MRMSGSAPDPRRVLVVQLRRIGDALLSTPAIRALGERFPGVEIDAVLDEPANEAFLGNPRVRRILVPPRGLGGHLRFLWELRRGGYDWVFDFLSNPRSAQYTRATGAPVRVGLDRASRRYAYTHRLGETEADRDLYAVDWRLRFLGAVGVPGAGRALELYADEAVPAEAERVARLLAGAGEGPVAAVAVGGGNAAKRYPTPLTARVIDRLREEGFVVVQTAGPGEEPQAERVRAALAGRAAGLLGLTDARIPTLAALYRRAAVYVGPDSATKHAAVAVGCPAVTLFGPGRPGSWNDLDSPRDEVLLAPCPVRPGCSEAECAAARHLGGIDPATVVAAALRRARTAIPAGRAPR